MTSMGFLSLWTAEEKRNLTHPLQKTNYTVQQYKLDTSAQSKQLDIFSCKYKWQNSEPDLTHTQSSSPS